MRTTRCRPFWLTMFVVAMGVCLASCRPHAPTSSPPAGVVKEYGGYGPLRLELRLDRERLTMAERLQVDLRAETDESHAIKFAELKEIDGFQVVTANESKPEMTSPGRVAVHMHYTLEPLTPGEFQVPVLAAEVWDKGEAKAAITTVRTEPVSIRVDTLLAKDDPGETISDIAPPVAKPVNPWLLIGAGAALVLILALVIYLWRKRRLRVIPPPPPLPPHLVAYQALDRLLSTDLLRRGELQEFYAILSDILRHYIEQRFGLRAPERTTEEFLLELRMVGSGPMANTSHRLLLRDFLTRCDLVKFACETPAHSEAEEAVEICRRFVRETEPALSQPVAGGTP